MVPQALLSGSCMLGEMKVMYRLATCSTVPHALPSRHSPWRRRWRRRKRASDATSTSESCTNPCRPPYPVLIHRSRPFQSVCCSTYQSPTGACKWFPKVLRFRRPRMLAFYCTWCRRGTRCLVVVAPICRGRRRRRRRGRWRRRRRRRPVIVILAPHRVISMLTALHGLGGISAAPVRLVVAAHVEFESNV